MARIPAHVPVPLRLTPLALMALETHLQDPTISERFEDHLEAQGVEADATEDAADEVLAEIRRAIDRATHAAPARRVQATTLHRVVLEGGRVLVNGGYFHHPDLVDRVRKSVVCRPTTEAGLPALVVSVVGGKEIGTATLVRDLSSNAA